MLVTALVFIVSIPQTEAASAFSIAKTISDRDGGALWGMKVCGPVMFADPETHEAVANQGDAQGQLHKVGDVWTGTLPKEMNISNTALDWAGVRWTMVMWQDEPEPRALAQLLGHECYHRIQPALNLAPKDGAICGHLDGKDGRIWLQLEWRALERALGETGEPRRVAVTDAIAFRSKRRALISGAAERENQLEMNEALAEYTGVVLGNRVPADRRAAAIARLRMAPTKQSFVRSFAYATGPSYGLLLDESQKPWRKTLTGQSDLGALLTAAYRVKAEDAEVAMASYDGDWLVAAETTRSAVLESEKAKLRQRFLEGPVVTLLPAEKFSMGFDPNGLVPLNEDATFYRTLRVSDAWGVLDVSNGAVVVRQQAKILRVVVAAAATLKNDDWNLQLAPGYAVVKGQVVKMSGR